MFYFIIWDGICFSSFEMFDISNRFSLFFFILRLLSVIGDGGVGGDERLIYTIYMMER